MVELPDGRVFKRCRLEADSISPEHAPASRAAAFCNRQRSLVAEYADATEMRAGSSDYEYFVLADDKEAQQGDRIVFEAVGDGDVLLFDEPPDSDDPCEEVDDSNAEDHYTHDYPDEYSRHSSHRRHCCFDEEYDVDDSEQPSDEY